MSSIHLIYFSPTHTTEKILKAIAEGTLAAYGGGAVPGGAEDGVATSSGKGERISASDVTFSAIGTETPWADSAITLIGAPVHGGRIPELVHSRLRDLRGGGRPAAVVVVYGNRAFEDALLELADLATERGFEVVSAAAFVGEHSYSTDQFPIAINRPDAEDLEFARGYGNNLVSRPGSAEAPAIPGNRPFKERRPSSGITPTTDAESCTRCLACVDACPTGAIAADDPFDTSAASCIRCSACIKICPTGARAYTDPAMLALIGRIKDLCETRREPEIFG